jgi:hypothetical protein
MSLLSANHVRDDLFTRQWLGPVILLDNGVWVFFIQFDRDLIC